MLKTHWFISHFGKSATEVLPVSDLSTAVAAAAPTGDVTHKTRTVPPFLSEASGWPDATGGRT
jgi:hypothetical protein